MILHDVLEVFENETLTNIAITTEAVQAVHSVYASLEFFILRGSQLGQDAIDC